MDKTEYATRLETLMKERHWDASTTAKRMGVSPVAIHKVLDKGGKFGVESLFCAARLFNVSAYWLHTGEGDRGQWMTTSTRSAGAGATSVTGDGVTGYRPSEDALALGRFYDSLPGDEDVKKLVWRRAAGILLTLDRPQDTPQNAAPSPAATPKKSDV